MFTKCMIYHWILYLNTTTGVISGAGTAHFSRADEVISFIGGGNQRTQRKPPTCCKSLTNFIT
jgi:hypothetical protein